MIISKLFKNTARFLIFHRTLFLLLKLRTLYMVFTHLRLVNWKFKTPLIVLFRLLEVIQNLLKKYSKWVFNLPREEKQHFNRSVIFNFKFKPSTLKQSSKLGSHWYDSWISQLLTENFQPKSHLTSLFMVSTLYKFQLDPNSHKNHKISYRQSSELKMSTGRQMIEKPPLCR